MENLMKVCCRCKIQKSVGEFYKNKSKKNGITEECKFCSKQYSSKYREANPEKIKGHKDKYRKANQKKGNEYSAKWRKTNQEKHKESIVKWRESNSEKENETRSKYREDMSDGYIKSKLKEQNYPQELIDNPEMIEIKRLIIQTKRLCKK